MYCETKTPRCHHSPARGAGALSCWKVTLRAVSKLIRIFHIGIFCFRVPFLKQLLLRNCAVDFVEICNVYIGKIIIIADKRIFNPDKIYRSYSDLNFGIAFMEHSVVQSTLLSEVGATNPPPPKERAGKIC